MTRDEFLKKYLTVVGKDAAVDNHDEAFIKKYLTQVGCPDGSGSGSGDHVLSIEIDSRGSGEGEVTANKESYKVGETARLTFIPSRYGVDKLKDIKVLTDGEYRPDAQGEYVYGGDYEFEVPDDSVKPYENLTAKCLLVSGDNWKEIDLNAMGSGSGSFELHDVRYEKAEIIEYNVGVYCNNQSSVNTITNITTDGSVTVKVLSDSDPVELPVVDGSCEFDTSAYEGDITVQVDFARE